MKKLFSSLVIFSMLAVFVPMNVGAATTWDVTGNYVTGFQLTGDPTVYSHDMVLSQDILDNVSGNGGYPAGGPFTFAWNVTSGNVTGNTITLISDYTLGAVGTTMNMVGTIALDGSMSGTWNDNYGGGYREGTWSTSSGNASQSVTVVVAGNTSAGENQPGWLFNRDVTTATPYVFTASEQSIGNGSLHVLPIGANASDKMIAENFINSPIADVNSISYDFKIGSTSLDTQEEQFYMNVYANFGESDDLKFYDCRYSVVPTVGSTGAFTTVTFDPTQAYPVTTRGGATPSPYACPSVPADMDLLSAGSNIRVFALNVGDTSASDVGLSGYLDNVVVSVGAQTTTYDFESVTAPVAVANEYSVDEDTLLSVVAPGVLGNDTDAELDSLTAVVVSGVSNGVLVLNSDGSFTYTPNANYNGGDSFTYKANDGSQDSNVVTVSITVNPIDEPVLNPTNKDQCMNDGWQNYGFKNQGLCIQYVNTAKDSR